MKKVLFVLALVAAYGVSMAMTSTVDVQETQVVILSEVDNNEGDKEGEKTAVTAKTPAKAEGCATAKTTAKAEGCATAKTTAKAEGCSGTKTAAKTKSGCESSCAGSTKTAQK